MIGQDLSQTALVARENEELRYKLEQNVLERTEDLNKANQLLRESLQEMVVSEEHNHHLNQVLKAIRNVNQLIIRERNPERLLAEACNILVQTLSYTLVWVGQAEAGHKHIVPVARAGRGVDYLDNIKITWDDSETGLGPAGMAVKTGKPACCQDMAHDPSVRPWREAALAQGFASVLAVPMILRDRTFRVLTVYADRPQAFDDEEIGLMEELVGDLAFALQSLENEAERKKAEKLLHESKNKYHTIFENSGTAIVALEEDTTISLANAEIERLTGYAKEEIEGKKSWTEFVAKDDLERMLNQHHARRIDPDVPPKNYEFHLKDKYGCIKNCLLTVDMIPGSKKSIASFIDVTERKRAEAALWREQKFNSALLENMVDGVVACDADGILTLFNRTAREWHGLDCMRIPPEEWASHYDLFCEDGVTPMSAASVPLFRAFQGEMLRDAGMVIQAKGQPLRYVLTNSTPFFDETGRKLGAVGVMHDITERKAMEEKLAATEEKYRLMVENLNDVIFTLDLQGVITYISPVIEQISDYTSEELIGQHFSNFVFPEDLPGLIARFKRSLGGQIGPFEFRTVNKAGHIRHVRSSTRLLLKGNQKLGLSGVLTDITERKRVEEALRESDAKFRLLFERSADAMLLLDEGKFIDCNQAAVMMMGYSTKDELLNHYPLELSPEKQPDGMSSFEKAGGLMKEAFETGSNRFEWVHCKADGKEFPVDVTLTAVPWNGKQILYTLWKDITEQKKAEEALRESKDFLDKIINSIGDPIFVKDREHRMVLINDVACKSFGLTRDEILGHTTHELFPIRKTAEVSWEKDEEVFRTGAENVNEETITFASGLIFTALVKKTLYIDKAGNQFIVGVVRDITERKRIEKALEESEKRYRLLFNGGSDAILVHEGPTPNGLPGKFIEVNDTACQRLGYTREELLSMSPADINVSETISADPDMMERLKAQKYAVWEGAHLTKDGHCIPVEISNNLFDLYGKPVILAIVRDITERKRMEEALRESLIKYRRLFENSPVGIISVDLDGRITEVNEALVKIMGSPSAEATKQINVFEFPLLVEAGFTACFRKCTLSGESVFYEHPYISNWGKLIYLRLRLNPIHDASDLIIGAQGIVEDISDQKQAEEALKESEMRYRTLAESAQDAIYMIAPDMRIMYVNRFAAKLLGTEQEAIVGKPLDSLFPADTTKIMAQSLLSVFQTGRPSLVESEVTFLQGTRWQNTSLAPIKDPSGKVTSVFGVSRDMTDQKLVEYKLIASLQEKEVLLREIRHRVKNNLQIISSLLSIQARYLQEGDTKNVLSECQGRVKSMALVHEILYRSENLARVNFAGYIRSLSKALFSFYNVDRRKIRLSLDLEEVFLGIDQAIPCGLILNELVTNCLKHAFPEGRTGEIRIDLLSSNDLIILVVKDNGIGLPEESELKETKSMGLKLVNSLVKQLKGTIEMDLSTGTEFRITFAAG